eukprot:COSAG01_NODE_430_length_17153_cov_24.866717_13_plen_83_part_00
MRAGARVRVGSPQAPPSSVARILTAPYAPNQLAHPLLVRSISQQGASAAAVLHLLNEEHMKALDEVHDIHTATVSGMRDLPQ